MKCMPPSKRDAPQAAERVDRGVREGDVLSRRRAGLDLREPAGATYCSGGSVTPVAARKASA